MKTIEEIQNEEIGEITEVETRFWNCSDEAVLDILTSAVQKMTCIYAERGEAALSYYEYKYAKQDYEDARAELLDRLQEVN